MNRPVERLRPLNLPTPVTVQVDAQGRPALVEEQRIETVGEVWRIDDEWWRETVSRRCYEVLFEGGGRLIVFQDLVTGEWFGQQP